MRRLQPKIASRLAAGLAAEDPCPKRLADLLERLARLRADFEASSDDPASGERNAPPDDEVVRREPGRNAPRR